MNLIFLFIWIYSKCKDTAKPLDFEAHKLNCIMVGFGLQMEHDL